MLDQARETIRDLARRSSEVRPLAPSLFSDRALLKAWLLSARRAQIALAAAVLIGLFVMPPIRDTLLEVVLPPQSQRSFFRSRVKPHPAFGVVSGLFTTAYWLVALGGTGILLWLHIPSVVLGRRETEHPPGPSPGPALPAGGDDPLATGRTMFADGAASSPGPAAPAGATALPVAAAVPPAGAATPGRPGGRYRIDDEIGRGAMGIVYRGEDEVLGRVVALKELPPQLKRDAALAQRFRQEARVLAQLSHPHIVQIFDLVEDPEHMWMAMELVTGGCLADRTEEGPMPLGEVVRLGRQMADALGFAHEQGVIHRDFKPHNVLLSPEGDAKVTDFGLAKLVQSGASLTQEGAILGSPSYMSPEQATGGDLDARTDIYSLGVALYEMCTGKVPFEGDTTSTLMKHITQPPPPPRTVVPDLPESLEVLVLDMLAKEPADRVPDMATAAARLAAIAGEAG